MTIPKILLSRSQLDCDFNKGEDGVRCLVVPADTYPELFNFYCPDVVEKAEGRKWVAAAPKGWCVTKAKNSKQLRFPPNQLSQDHLERIAEWIQHFEQYVLIGLNDNIKNKKVFGQELDFCVGLSFTYDLNAKKRTPVGEALYQAKYKESNIHLAEITTAMADAIAFLPIPPEETANLLVTGVPSDASKPNFGRELTKSIATAKGLPIALSQLACKKAEMKNLPLAQKVKQWRALYGSGQCVTIKADVKGKTMIIIDDLHQSGSTIWCYAEHLKKLGAKHVLGLVGVKTLRDTDNK